MVWVTLLGRIWSTVGVDQAHQGAQGQDREHEPEGGAEDRDERRGDGGQVHEREDGQADEHAEIGLVGPSPEELVEDDRRHRRGGLLDGEQQHGERDRGDCDDARGDR